MKLEVVNSRINSSMEEFPAKNVSQYFIFPSLKYLLFNLYCTFLLMLLWGDFIVNYSFSVQPRAHI